MHIANTELKRLLAVVKPAIARKSPLPALSNVLLSAENGVVYLTAHDMSLEITARGVADGDLDPVCVHPDRLAAALASGGDLDIKPNDSQLSLRAGRARYTAATLPAEDFPRIEQVQGAETFSLTDIAPAVASALPFAAVNDVRYYLCGVLLHADPARDVMNVVTTDGHRLARITVPLAADLPQIILPLNVAHLIAGGSWTRATTDGKRITLLADGAEAHAPLIDGRFPDYNRVIPDCSKSTTVVTEFLLGAMNAVRGYATSGKHGLIRLSQVADELTIDARSDSAEDASATLPAAGDPFIVGMNFRYLDAVLDAIDADRIDIQWAAEEGARRFDHRNATYVVMPARL